MKAVLPQCHGIIPARYASTRFPGKPLALIQGKPMFFHVYTQAAQCRELSTVTLATDDDRIMAAAKQLNVPCVMTRNDHASGTDRVLEAALHINVPDSSVVINIQGDEPALEPGLLSQLILPFESPEIDVTTPVRPISEAEAKNPDRVKVVFDRNKKALYFSRSMIPFTRDEQKGGYFGHIGLYAFRMRILKQFVSLGESPLEKREKLEQLRLLENGIPIHVVETDYQNIGVDRPEDLTIIEKSLADRKQRRYDS